ncbi:glutathione S-transferase [Denitromonas ohlonensis]|uniref:Glutathione S-transferase n=2 Tax=Denitromonas TaxID=139331 RepID=A0A558EDR6_9RHOO|nr:glutathione S-transferase [Denitromonas ohlonensis]TVT48262.1 MAG: glutathione S-transferase [Denitromonas halophila]TVO66802.1 glutathione S-transferase [Denitromonas ohlonensis]TVO79672.1 glutathione S-transferase [Denitromonas ohlonensis]TVT71465.1 MAG: glutathione S-transferase [Denitromonas halophila]TVT76889.1 MAG: glutathione S-transferase [Denitromonas halophila]
MRPILYSFRRCPYAIRARLALWQAGVVVALREVVLRDKPVHLLELSPKGTVPVMRLPDGRVLEESLDIMHWALQQNDPDGWLRTGDSAEQAVLVARNDIDFKPLLDRYKYAERFPEKSAVAWRNAAIAAHLTDLEARLTDHAYLFGDTPSLADAALFPFVRQFAAVDAAWFEKAPLPALRRWLKVWLASPLFAAVMVRHRTWQEPR